MPLFFHFIFIQSEAHNDYVAPLDIEKIVRFSLELHKAAACMDKNKYMQITMTSTARRLRSDAHKSDKNEKRHRKKMLT